MPQLHLIINPSLVGTSIKQLPVEWAQTHGFANVRLPVEEVLDEIDQVAVFPRWQESLEPTKHLLVIEFLLDTGRFYSAEGNALRDALAIYIALADPKASWKLPKQWGFWFKCKGSFNDIWISPENFNQKSQQLKNLLGLN